MTSFGSRNEVAVNYFHDTQPLSLAPAFNEEPIRELPPDKCLLQLVDAVVKNDGDKSGLSKLVIGSFEALPKTFVNRRCKSNSRALTPQLSCVSDRTLHEWTWQRDRH